MIIFFRNERLAPAVGEKDRAIPIAKNRVTIQRNMDRIGVFKFFLSRANRNQRRSANSELRGTGNMHQAPGENAFPT